MQGRIQLRLAKTLDILGVSAIYGVKLLQPPKNSDLAPKIQAVFLTSWPFN